MSSQLKIRGYGEIHAQPDMMRFNYELVQDALSYGESLDQLKAQYEVVIQAFKKLGLNTALIQTSSVNVSILSQYEERPKGFRSSQRIVFEDTIDLDKMSELLDALREQNDFNFSLSYFVKDTSHHDNDAIILAINDATDRAKLIAENAGVKLGSIHTIEYGMDMDHPVMYRSVASDAMHGMQASNVVISKSVTIIWGLK